MEKAPMEIWGRIFSFACIDDGYTGHSLSQVSRYFRVASNHYQLQSVALSGRDQIQRFADLLENTHPRCRSVRYLYVSESLARDDIARGQDLAQRYPHRLSPAEMESLSPEDLVRKYMLHECHSDDWICIMRKVISMRGLPQMKQQLAAERQQSLSATLLRILQLVSSNLQTLTMCMDKECPDAFFAVSFPRLTELHLVTTSDPTYSHINAELRKVHILPSLTHLHLTNCAELLEAFGNRVPCLAHLRLTDMGLLSSAILSTALSASSVTEGSMFPGLVQVIVQPEISFKKSRACCLAGMKGAVKSGRIDLLKVNPSRSKAYGHRSGIIVLMSKKGWLKETAGGEGYWEVKASEIDTLTFQQLGRIDMPYERHTHNDLSYRYCITRYVFGIRQIRSLKPSDIAKIHLSSPPYLMENAPICEQGCLCQPGGVPSTKLTLIIFTGRHGDNELNMVSICRGPSNAQLVLDDTSWTCDSHSPYTFHKYILRHLCMKTRIAVEEVPLEIWARIFCLACTDDGSTGCSLSQVSRYIRAASSEYRLQSIALAGIQQMRSFGDLLVNTRSDYHRVRYLYVSEFLVRQRSTVPFDSEDMEPTGTHRPHDHSTDEDRTREEHSIFVATLSRILWLIHPHIQTLTVCLDREGPDTLFETPFPRLTELDIVFEVSRSFRSRDDVREPPRIQDLSSLTHLHLDNCAHLLAAFRGRVPRLAHLRLTEMNPLSSAQYVISRALSTQSESSITASRHPISVDLDAFPTLGRIIIQPPGDVHEGRGCCLAKLQDALKSTKIVLLKPEDPYNKLLLHLDSGGRSARSKQEWSERTAGGEGVWKINTGDVDMRMFMEILQQQEPYRRHIHAETIQVCGLVPSGAARLADHGLRRTYQASLKFETVKTYAYQHDTAVGQVKFILLFSVYYDRPQRSGPWSRTVVFLLSRHYQMSRDERLKDTVAVLLDWRHSRQRSFSRDSGLFKRGFCNEHNATSPLQEQVAFVPYGHEGHLALALTLYHELTMGEESEWYGYLQSLPTSVVPNALFWGHDDAGMGDHDGREARAWLDGTEVEKEFCDEHGVDTVPLFNRLDKPCTLQGFILAYSLCDIDVCPTCGSLDECPHDREDPSLATSQIGSSLSRSEVTCDMVTNRPVLPNSEIFNTYGHRLGNASLLARYGFALEGNEHDIVSWELSIHDLLRTDEPLPLSPDEFTLLFRKLAKLWARSLSSIAGDNSTLVYRPVVPDGEEPTYTGWQSHLCINSEAQVSVHLWLYAALRAVIAMKDEGPVQSGDSETWSVGEVVPLLGRAMDAQVGIEKFMNVTDETIDGEEMVVDIDVLVSRGLILEASTWTDSSTQPKRILGQIAATVCMLCTQRISRLGKQPALSTADLGDYFDSLPTTREKTRLALAEVITERTILESCHAVWQDFLTVLVDDAE
ncbi:hypothetical protein POSPLADRAFT_1182201 [Postia placenta MAD-698-R-SB12]|uniref:SET domain-containing protein n=1 Tax=Postia placenta MAD-698-R-SB12 TaxID=670580 RepID=A0A1X6MXS1_9APHY|nr:hypothetical protein POSPLADRAFT_1182201 [Postia placenta MAD-698-R-SB12]OSX61040.1 hypothetical protein POSPLADRAFT_1182201 [Postia placenta MAD-698-R-SB12]